MRISNNSAVGPYLRQLNLTQERKYQSDLRVATGSQLITLSDSPTALVNTKQISEKLDRNKKYLNNINESYNEMQAVNDSLASFTR